MTIAGSAIILSQFRGASAAKIRHGSVDSMGYYLLVNKIQGVIHISTALHETCLIA